MTWSEYGPTLLIYEYVALYFSYIHISWLQDFLPPADLYNYLGRWTNLLNFIETKWWTQRNQDFLDTM